MNEPAPVLTTAVPEIRAALREFGIDDTGLAALRAFSRVVTQADFAHAFADCLAAVATRISPSAEAVEAEAAFCERLAASDRWHAPEDWFDDLQAHWQRCLVAGSDPALALEACGALIRAAAQPLARERAMVYQLELDILFAIEGFAWCIARLLVSIALAREAELRRRADDWDPLTGLASRHRYDRMLATWLGEDRPEGRVGLVVLAMEWGVAVRNLPLAERDRLRLAVADKLREVVRPGDVLCVTGDHEWSLLLPALRSPAQVRLAANRLIAACEGLLGGEFRELCGRLRGGGAVGPDHGDDPASLEYAARTALLVAHQDDLHFEDYRADFTGAVRDSVVFERELLDAIHLQQLELHLQPQVRLDDGRCEAAELLLRWRRQDGSWVAPPAIIDGALRLGVLPRLSRWLVMHAARTAAALERAGMPLRVNLNITAMDLKDEELPDLVAQALSVWRVPPSRFGLEVTETALVSDQPQAAALIGRLRRLGCPVALDDFGTGFSSLAYLRNLPVTELKIDQMFVRQLRDSRADQAIVEAIMRLADGFGLQVVAEGVEDPAARELLHRAGCDLMQGFLEGAAMPFEAFVEWWHRRGGRPAQ